MSTTDTTPYRVEITLQPPEAAERLTLTLMLHPADSVPLGGGNAKRVRDCTLAELQAYANALEVDLGAALQNRTVGTLVEQAELPIVINAASADWLDQIIVLDTVDTAPAAPPAAEESGPAAPPAEAENAPAAEPSPVETPAAVVPAATEPVEEIAVQESVADGTTPDESVSLLEDQITAAAPTPTAAPTRPPALLPKPAPRTAGQLARADYPRNNAVIILVDEQPLRQMESHAGSSLRREVAGFMLGPRPEKQPDGHYVVHITDMLVAGHTKMSGASVTYTPESWRDMHDRRLARYPDDDVVVVGWYHTHPGFGIFLSNMDLFIHTNFFTQKWHIAYVLDPVAQRSGFFSWDRTQAQVVPYPFAWPEWAANSW